MWLSHLLLKILLTQVTGKSFMYLLWFEFFLCNKNWDPVVWLERVYHQELLLIRFLNHWLFVSSLKASSISDDIRWNLWQNATNFHDIKRKLATNKQIFGVFEVSGDLYCSRNVNRPTETDTAKLILIW